MKRIVKVKEFMTKYATITDAEIVIMEDAYPGGATAIRIYGEGELYTTATVDLDFLPEEGNVIIKNWSKNKGFLEQLQAHGIVGKTLVNHPTGFVTAQEVKLLV